MVKIKIDYEATTSQGLIEIIREIEEVLAKRYKNAGKRCGCSNCRKKTFVTGGKE